MCSLLPSWSGQEPVTFSNVNPSNTLFSRETIWRKLPPPMAFGHELITRLQN